MAERLRSRGFGVYVVPEAATLMMTGGASFSGMTKEQVLNFQTALLRTQLALEDAFYAVASASAKTSFVLCDRGTCDGRAYMSSELWSTMLRANNWDMVAIRDARYDLVVHLVTAADGAEEYYQLENNQVRTETPSEARRVDHKTQKAWVGHPHLRIVDNRTGFREKINRVDAIISELAGVHLSKRVVRKFLLEPLPSLHAAVDSMAGFEEFEVEQTFLKKLSEEKVQESVRKRGKHGVFTFVHKVRTLNRETKRQITNREYLSLLAHSDPERRTLRITRQCFLYSGNYFVFDNVLNVEPTVLMLRCHCDEGYMGRLDIPSWLTVSREVTGESEFSMHELSLRVSPVRPLVKVERYHDNGDYAINSDDFARSC